MADAAAPQTTMARCLAVLLLCVALLLPGAVVAADPLATADDHVLVLGRVSDDPKSHYDQLKPLLDYIVPRMASVGIRSGRVLMAKDLQQMSSYLRRGRVDLLNETAGNAAVLGARGVAQPVLISERDGALRYHSIYFVRRDSPIRALADLRGHSIAFQSPYSTSAYYLPAAQLTEAGLPLMQLLSPMDKPSAGEVGYVFARTERNITTWVHKRLVDAGVLANLDWLDPQRMPPVFVQDFRVIARSEDVPRALMMVRTGLPPRVAQRLQEVLEQAASDPAAAPALQRFLQTTRFVPITGDDRAALDRLAHGVQRIRLEVE